MEIRPYYHPTTTAIIDDSPDFLANLGLNLDPSLAYRIFESPLTALTALGSVDANAVGPERFFTMYEGREPPSCDHHVIDLNIALFIVVHSNIASPGAKGADRITLFQHPYPLLETKVPVGQSTDGTKINDVT